MTEISRPFTGTIAGGALGDAGPYSAEQWRTTWRNMIGEGAENANRGVIRGVLNELEVTANSPAAQNVLVESGAAMVQGGWYLNDATVTQSIAANASGSTRIDIIVLEMDYTAQTIRIAVVQGTPAAGVPNLTQTVGVLWQIPLAYLTLASGYATITASMITDMRHYANIPSATGINVTNNSGSTLEQGATVIWIATGGLSINTTTTAGHKSFAGIIESRVSNTNACRIITSGVTAVMCDEAVAIGDYLELSTTAGQAQKLDTAVGNGKVLGFVLAANTGAGTRCLAYVFSDTIGGYFNLLGSDTDTVDRTTTSTTFVAIDAGFTTTVSVIAGKPILILLNINVDDTAGPANHDLDFSVGGSRVGGTHGIQHYTNVETAANLFYVHIPTTTGSLVITPQWRCDSAGTIQANNATNAAARLWVLGA